MHLQQVRPNSAKVALLVMLCAVALFAAPRKKPKPLTQAQLADSFQRKINQVEANSKRDKPSSDPTVFEEKEINAWFAERRLRNMPEGVKSVRFELKPAMVTAYTTVDFEQIRKSRPSSNPLLAIFDGIHDAEVVAYAEGSSNVARVRVDSVHIDGVPVPRKLLEMFIERWVNPKYPQVKLDGEYKLPARIDSARIEDQRGIIAQK